MTQIVTTTATTGNKGIGASRAHGAKAGAGGDFAAMVAGLGGKADPAGANDPDALTIADDSDAKGDDADKGSEKGKAGEPVVLDLALGAAAQSAVADMVVTPPTSLLVQVPVPTAAGRPATDASTTTAGIEGVSAPTRARGKRADFGVDAGVASTPAVKADAAATAQVSTAQVPTGAAAAEALAKAALPASAPAASGEAVVADTVPTTSIEKPVRNVRRGQRDTTTIPASSPRAASTAAPIAGTATLAGATGVSLPVMGKQASGDVAVPRTAAPAIQPASGETASPVSEKGVLPLPAAQGAPEPVTDATPSTDVAPVPAASADTAAAYRALRSALGASLPLAGEASQRPIVAPMPQAAQLPGATTESKILTATDAVQATAPVTVQPVMSTLHRASPASVQAKAGEPVPLAAVGGNSPRSSRDSGSDDKANSGSSGATLGHDDTQGSTASTDALPGGRQFADIIQSLPPIAQSRIGGVSDVAPVVTGAADVGASLQGQAIDMTVGGQWIDRMAKEITALAAGTGHSRFQLSPPNLGRIQIDVWQGESGGKVQLLTETDEAARHLREGQSSLQSDARLSALQLNSITIERAPAAGFDTSPDQSNPQQNLPQQRQGSDQGSQSGQTGTQANMQGGSQQNGQQNAQAGLQSGMQGGNSNGQGKSSPRRDVLNHQADIADRQGGSTGRDGDRLVRYA